MIIWINGAFGSGKTTAAFELHRRIENSFVYDPENVGYFIRKNTPKKFTQGDFQDIPLWREMNYKMLKMISVEYNGTIIVPMTLTNLDYYNEIISKLLSDGIEIRHFILYTSKPVLIKRLNKRFDGAGSWPRQQIDRCINAFDNHITEQKIMTDNKSIDDVVDEIASKSGLLLPPDNRSLMRKKIDKIKISLSHIR